ncbi:hypothetical protein T484DRAFT_3627379, partial [Baffinella frigidus]
QGGILLLRVPHSSGETQGEDTSIFNRLKRLLRGSRGQKLAAKLLKKGWYATPRPDGKPWADGLKNEDVMYILCEPWKKAFSKENILTGFRVTGICPCTRRPQFKMAQKEAKARHALGAAARHGVALDMSESLIIPSSGPYKMPTFEAGAKYNSSRVWQLGPATSEETISIAQAARDKTNADKKKKEDCATARSDKANGAFHASLALLDEIKTVLGAKQSVAGQDVVCVLEESDFVGKGHALKASHVWAIFAAYRKAGEKPVKRE